MEYLGLYTGSSFGDKGKTETKKSDLMNPTENNLKIFDTLVKNLEKRQTEIQECKEKNEILTQANKLLRDSKPNPDSFLVKRNDEQRQHIANLELQLRKERNKAPADQTEQIQELQEQILNLEQGIRKVDENSVLGYINSIKKLDKDKEELIKRIGQLTGENTDLKTKVNELENVKNTLLKTIESNTASEAKNDELTAEIISLKSKNTLLGQTFDDMFDTYIKTIEENAELETEIDKCEKQKKKLEESLETETGKESTGSTQEAKEAWGKGTNKGNINSPDTINPVNSWDEDSIMQ